MLVYCTGNNAIAVNCTGDNAIAVHCTGNNAIAVHCTGDNALAVHCTGDNAIAVHCTEKLHYFQYRCIFGLVHYSTVEICPNLSVFHIYHSPIRNDTQQEH